MQSKNVDTHRIYVTGLSMGGMGVWDIMGREPKLFAAAVPMSGGGDLKEAPIIKDIPTWDFHGADDNIVPVWASQEMIQAIKDAGGSPIYSELPGQGHEIWDPLYDKSDISLYSWMFSQVNPNDPPLFEDQPSGLPGAWGDPTVPPTLPEPAALTWVLLGGLGLSRRFSRRARPRKILA